MLSHVVHYGSSIFEGIRCYETAKGSAVFRLDEHINRLFDSAKIYRMEIPYTRAEIKEAILETIRVNQLAACYIRPVVFRGYENLGVDPMGCPVDVVIAVWEWGEYLGEAALKNGVSVCTSSWNRMAPNTFPALAKAGGNYLNSQLVRIEANANGYDEGIVLGTDGLVSEGSGENIFVIKNGSIYTPESCFAILPGITRHTAITLIRDLGMRVERAGFRASSSTSPTRCSSRARPPKSRQSAPLTKCRSAAGSAGRSLPRYKTPFSPWSASKSRIGTDG